MLRQATEDIYQTVNILTKIIKFLNKILNKMKYNLEIRKMDVLLLKLIESSVRKMYEPQLRNSTSNAIFESKLFFARNFLHDTRCSLTCTFDQLAWKIDSRLIHVMNFVSASRTRRSHSSARGISISETVPLSTGYYRVSRASFLKFMFTVQQFSSYSTRCSRRNRFIIRDHDLTNRIAFNAFAYIVLEASKLSCKTHFPLRSTYFVISWILIAFYKISGCENVSYTNLCKLT